MLYQDNKVTQDHIIHGFQNWLSSFNVPYNTVHLGGMTEENVLSLISNALGMLPCLCQSLAQVVYRKTEGNPLFVQTFLRSLGEYMKPLTYLWYQLSNSLLPTLNDDS